MGCYDGGLVPCRAEMSIGQDLDWIWTMTNFVEVGLEPDCKMLHKFLTRTGFGMS